MWEIHDKCRDDVINRLLLLKALVFTILTFGIFYHRKAIYLKIVIQFTWKRLMGCILRLQNFPSMLYIYVAILTRDSPYMQKNDLCDTLDGLCYVFWSCISWVIIMSYFSIEVLLSWCSLFLIQWFFSQPRMKNLDTIFQWFLLLLPGFLLILTVFFYHILLQHLHTKNLITNFPVFVKKKLRIITIKHMMW